MALFHPRVINKHTQFAPTVPPQHIEILGAWAESLVQGTFERETSHDGEFIQRILIDVLGYKGSSAGTNWTVAKNQPVGSGNVDAALGSFSSDTAQIIAPFELKGAKTRDLDATMPGRNKSPVQQAWEYAMDAKGAKWVLVSNYREIRLYAVGYGRKDFERFDLSQMTLPQNYARFMLLLSAENLLGNRTIDLLKESENKNKEITNKLYQDYKALRAQMISTLAKNNSAVPILEIIQHTQTILDRILFVAFAEDKGLLPENTLKSCYEDRGKWNPQPAWENFKGLFESIDKGNPPLNIPGYNGGLFAQNNGLNALILSDSLCESFKSIGEYDFDSDVSVNILGHIFEQSITDLEDIKANVSGQDVDGKKSKRKKDGIFYTPPYVTRYIVEQAVGGWLNDRKKEIGFEKLPVLEDEDYASIKTIKKGRTITYNAKIEKHIKAWEAYKAVLSGIKVLDPACGSGAFLNEVFDYLYREGQVVNSELATLNAEQEQLFRWDTHILANNIYGVDINQESVEITKLSLWLKTANRNEKLTYLDDNIKCGNSLIDDPAIAGDLAFKWEKEFADIMSAGGFDVVVGNPPYIDSEEMVRNHQQRQRDYIATHYPSAKGNWDIYIAFFDRAFSLLTRNGLLCFITPDKWLSKEFGSELRKNLLRHIRTIFVVGRDVFESAKVDSVITKISKNPDNQISTFASEETRIRLISKVNNASLSPPFALDTLFSNALPLLSRIEEACPNTFQSFAACESACATSDAYLLKDILCDIPHHDFNEKKHFKVVNTGTLGRYIHKWGIRPMRYLKDDYHYPVVNRADFNSMFGKTYVQRASSPKLIIKGLTLLDASIDFTGSCVPGKSTLVIMNQEPDFLKFMAVFLNSRLPIFYIKEKYQSSSYNGGISFTKDMINQLPIPQAVEQRPFIEKADIMLAKNKELHDVSSKFLALLKSEFGIDKPGGKLEQWYTLDFSTFCWELAKKKIALTLAQKAEWMEHFEKQKAIAAALKSTIDTTDREIDQLVYSLYSLTPEEIRVIESEAL
jgi:type I restriction-modification system DNA methylase subunit